MAFEKHLIEFSKVADDWFSKQDYLEERYKFFKEFFKKENLEKAEWEDFQKIGDKIHAFNSMPLSKQKALGRPNHPIEHYRNSFIYLVHGLEPIDVRISNFFNNPDYKIRNFGESVVSELLGYIFVEKFVLFNERDKFALKVLDIDPKFEKNDGFLEKYIKFNQAIQPLVETYKNFIGQKTEVPINLEIDQFFSYLYEMNKNKVALSDHIPMKPMSNRNKIVAALKTIQGPASPSTILNAIRKAGQDIRGETPLNTIRSECSLMIRNGFLISQERGTYSINEEGATNKGRHQELQHAKSRSGAKDNFIVRSGSNRTKIIAAFQKIKGPATPSQILDAIRQSGQDIKGQTPLNTIRSECSLLIRSGFLVSPERGVYMINEKKVNNLINDAVLIDRRYKTWVFCPDIGEQYWNSFIKDGIIAIGWDSLGDLDQYKDHEEIHQAMLKNSNAISSNLQISIVCHEFNRVMQIGDYVIAIVGSSQLIGFGEILSDYHYDAARLNYKHIRKIKWIKIGNWRIPQERQITVETLTDFSEHLEWLSWFYSYINKKLSRDDLHCDQIEKKSIGCNGYWWLDLKVTIRNLMDTPIGEKQTSVSDNEDDYFIEVKPGDILIGYVTSPQREITTICEITKGLHRTDEGDVFEFVKTEQLKIPISFEVLEKIPALKDCEPLHNHKGSLFKIHPGEYEIIKTLIDEANIQIHHSAMQPYTIQNAMIDLFLSESEFNEILNLLRTKKNIILQGPPGVGKSYIAKRIAYSLAGFKAKDKIEMIQFHQSYSYEDFVQGFRPNTDGKFNLRNGVFYEFCRKAQRDLHKPYIFIIDEINRGNLSKILGELMLLIEHDKRGMEFAIPLTYSQNMDERFFIPSNIHLIGMMNTADRSLAMVDYALRRRFTFISLQPAFQSPKFKEYLSKLNIELKLINLIIERMTYLNNQIASDCSNLGEGYRIGHSYFCPTVKDTNRYDMKWYNNIIKFEIEPLLREYWFEDPDKADSAVSRLYDN